MPPKQYTGPLIEVTDDRELGPCSLLTSKAASARIRG